MKALERPGAFLFLLDLLIISLKSSLVLEIITENYEYFLDVAYSITKCHSSKKDLINDTFLRLESLVKRNPEKEINEGYVYLTMKSIFISEKRKNRETLQESAFFVYMVDEESEKTETRLLVNQALNEIPFINREVLLKSQEIGMKQISRESDIPYCRIKAIKKESLQMLESKLNKAI